jgi:hypothetical protein
LGLLAMAEVLAGFGPGHFIVRERAEPDAFLTFRPWLTGAAVALPLLFNRPLSLAAAGAAGFVLVATLAEWLLLQQLGQPGIGVMLRSLLASGVILLAALAISAGFLRLFGGARRLTALMTMIFMVGLLALRPPYPSPMRWFETMLRPPAPSRPDAIRPEVRLFTDLPLVWGEGAVEDVLGGASPPAAYRAIANAATVTPVDVLDDRALDRARLLVIAQPRALVPEELVRIDAWVRGGGRALIFADPVLRWAEDIPPGRRRPPRASLLAPLLSHWGLMLAAGPPGYRMIGAEDGTLFGAGRIAVRDAGRLMATSSSACDLRADGLIADCTIATGRAVVVADADLLRDETWTGPGPYGATRNGRLADNGVFAAGAVRLLATGATATSGADRVRWMSRPPADEGRLLAVGLGLPVLVLAAAAGIAIRLRRV